MPLIKAAGTGVGNLPIGQGWSGAVDGSDFKLCSSSVGLISMSLLETTYKNEAFFG